MFAIRPLRRLYIIGFIGACLVPLRLSAQRPERPYDEAGVRLIMLDIALGQQYAYWRGQGNQPDAREAIRRWDAGVRVRNADSFERAARGRSARRYAFREGNRDAVGTDVVLTTDPVQERPADPSLGYDEAQVRLILLDMTLAQNDAAYRRRMNEPNVREAVRRWDAGVRVRDADRFETRRGPNGGRRVYRGSDREATGTDVVLTTDAVQERPAEPSHGYDEAQVRLILLDMALARDYANYRRRTDEPNVREAVRRWDAGVRVRDADRFETRRGPNGWRRVYRGSDRDADGMDVALTTDAAPERGVAAPPGYDEARVRLILLDLALGQTVAYYREHADQPDTREALRRWEVGVRVRNADRFERKQLHMFGMWRWTYRGTDREVDGRDVVLTTDAEPERRYAPPPATYDEAMVRLIMLDIALGQEYVYWRERTDQPDAREAIRRWDAGVRVRNADRFEMRTRRSGDVRRRWRGTNREADGMDVVLTTDAEQGRVVVAPPAYDEGRVRLILLDLTSGETMASYRAQANQPDQSATREALRRWDAGVRVRNAGQFERKRIGLIGAWHWTYRGTDRAVVGQDIVLTTDAEPGRGAVAPPGYDEARVRLILLDLALGQTVAYYREHADQPDTREALRRWEAGVRVRNADRFERKQLHMFGMWQWTYRGTDRAVDGRDVVLTTDAGPDMTREPPPATTHEPPPAAYNEAMVRLILLDITLARNVATYRGRMSQPDVREALRRWDAGVRVRNASRFEVRPRRAGDVHRRWRGTNREADGMDVILSTDPPQRRP